MLAPLFDLIASTITFCAGIPTGVDCAMIGSGSADKRDEPFMNRTGGIDHGLTLTLEGVRRS